MPAIATENDEFKTYFIRLNLQQPQQNKLFSFEFIFKSKKYFWSKIYSEQDA